MIDSSQGTSWPVTERISNLNVKCVGDCDFLYKSIDMIWWRKG